ncbi:Histidine kinase, HAMP region:Bacterial chemotaxis sensory transducer [Pararhodospirillum photometricum DSM 122]|uniref:Histidine kinase, HAMP region:Bacterial chemotaxis sensory transducer n=2 Tax=Pararhodospirillum photometricum TaxID=1084 RepID=H6SMX5_PARPM|nr:Histidine kinase, HAMP region:Bacterial chemotaxis sensory transducer [Pararhodospirillum photometricum DSM 122]
MSDTGVWLANAVAPEKVGSSVASLRDATGQPLGEKLLALGRLGEGTLAYTYHKPGSDTPQPKISYVQRFAPWGIIFISGVYRDDLDQSFFKILGIMSALSFGVILMTGSLLLILSRGITRPLESLKEKMVRLAHNEWSVTLEEAERRDEIGAMGRALQVFRDMGMERERLAAAEAEACATREARARTLESLATDFDRSVSVVLTTVSSAAGQLEFTAQGMSANADQTNKQASTVCGAIDCAASSVQTAATAAEELATSIQEISRQIELSTRLAQGASAEANRTNQTVKGLAESSGRISEVIRLINDIASQTNLLALNATIEAARAGDAGKGFAVVAGEVKTLASQTGRATEEISTQITAVQKASEEAVMAIADIVGRIEDINEIAAAIAAAMEQHSAATAEIARNVQQAASVTGVVTDNIGDVSQAAGETGQAANEVLQAARQLTGQAHDLKSVVDHFLTRVRA